ncbi:MAG: hypothetical protein RLZZ50_822 [Verrucomicrobiota bacterium]|jgi:hypothetical protein
MITNSQSVSPGAAPGPDPRRNRPAGTTAAPAFVPSDRISTERADQMREALTNTPVLRAEAVERAGAIAVDPNYPPLQIIERVARLLAESQDMSEEQ